MYSCIVATPSHEATSEQVSSSLWRSPSVARLVSLLGPSTIRRQAAPGFDLAQVALRLKQKYSGVTYMVHKLPVGSKKDTIPLPDIIPGTVCM